MSKKEDFIIKYYHFQRTHNIITLGFILVLFVQAVLAYTFHYWDHLRGWRIFVLCGLDLGTFILLLIVNKKKRGTKCPHCGRFLGHRDGQAVLNTGQCPYCKKIFFR